MNPRHRTDDRGLARISQNGLPMPLLPENFTDYWK
jgi:hypothetical protein